MKFKSADQRKAVMASLNTGRPTSSSDNVPYAKKVPRAIDESKVDTVQADEVEIQITNDGEAYRQSISPTIASLKRKYEKGQYDQTLARKQWYNVVTNWERNHRDDVGTVNKDTRLQVAKQLEIYYKDDIEYKG